MITGAIILCYSFNMWKHTLIVMQLEVVEVEVCLQTLFQLMNTFSSTFLLASVRVILILPKLVWTVVLVWVNSLCHISHRIVGMARITISITKNFLLDTLYSNFLLLKPLCHLQRKCMVWNNSSIYYKVYNNSFQRFLFKMPSINRWESKS